MVRFRVRIRIVTFRIWHSQAKCILIAAVCLSVSRLVSCPHYCTDPDNGRGCSLVAQYGVDLQSVHGFRCYGSIHVKCEMSARRLVYTRCMVG